MNDQSHQTVATADTPLLQILRGLSTKQVWSLVATVVGVLTAVIGTTATLITWKLEASTQNWLPLKAQYLERHLDYELSREQTPATRDLKARLFTALLSDLWAQQQKRAVSAALDSKAGMPIIVMGKPANPTAPGPTKIISFPDGTSYAIPFEIASRVHTP